MFNIGDKIRAYRRSDYTDNWQDTGFKGVIIGFSYPKKSYDPNFVLVSFEEKGHVYYQEFVPINSERFKIKLT